MIRIFKHYLSNNGPETYEEKTTEIWLLLGFIPIYYKVRTFLQ